MSPEEALERRRLVDREYTRRRRSVPGSVHQLVNRLRPMLRWALRRVGDGRGRCFKWLPYSPAQLAGHVAGRLQAHQHTCRLCGASLRERFDIDHVIPLSKAQTAQDVIRLFALENLDVLCPHCNQHVKRDQAV